MNSLGTKRADNEMPACMLPLDQRQISFSRNGVKDEISAINKLWADLQYEWIPYRPPPQPQDLSVAGASETWSERSKMIIEDLDHLLRLPYHKFWSQCVYDNRLHINLGQLLQRLPRPHDYEPLDRYPNHQIRSLVSKIARKVFLVFLRLSTHKESSENYITPSVFGKIVYDNFLFDVPRLMDLCVLFYNDNASLVEKMVGNVLKQAGGRYDNDIKQAAQTIKEALIKVQQKIDNLVFQTPGILVNAEHSEVHQELMDLTLYSADILQTISTFINAYPYSSTIFHNSHHHSSKAAGTSLLLTKKQNAAEAFLFRHVIEKSQSLLSENSSLSSSNDAIHLQFENFLASFYEHSLIPAYRHVLKQKKLNNINNEIAQAVLARIQLARQSAINSYRSLLNSTCLSPLLEGIGSSDNGKLKPCPIHVAGELAEDYMLIITSCLSERHFFLDYSKIHPVREDLEIFQQVGIEIDPMRVQYLYDGIDGLKSISEDKLLANKTKQECDGATSLNFEEQPCHRNTNDTPQGFQPGELDSLVSQVRDLFPNLGDGFVISCLEYFDHSPEQVINTLLEENLPPHLTKMDRNLPKQAVSVPSDDVMSKKDHQQLQHRENMTNKRLNIYDGDEFDVNARDTIDISKIHKGKQRRAKNTNAMLDDKSFIKSAEMREKFAALSIVVDEELVVPGASGGGYDYDDEYDDTYDDQAMGEKEPDANELESRRPFVLPQALGGGHKAYVKESEDETDEEEHELIRFDFARNPELVRKEAERKRQEAMSKNSKPKSSTAPHRDVTGRAKGQGQAKNVVINRQRKTENKGKRTRAAADNKMSKGMF